MKMQKSLNLQIEKNEPGHMKRVLKVPENSEH